MAFPPAFLEELRSRLPLSEIVGKRIKLTRAGREHKACCPFHNEKSPSFYVNDEKQFYHCFGCGAHGDIIGFVMHNDRLSFPEAIESLAALASLPVPRDTPLDRERFDHEKHLLQLLERTSTFFEEQLFAPTGREALTYLRGRGLSDEAIRRFHLGYAPNDGQTLIRKLVSEGYKIEELVSVGLAKKSEERNDFYSFFRNRVIFPVGDRRGRTVAFGGRVLGDGEPKYLNSPDHPLFHKGKLLYGLSRARTAMANGQPVIVVEGYMDVIALVEAGYTGAVAPLGTALTDDQLLLLWKLLPPLEGQDPSRDYSPILCFDGDNAGLRAALRAIERALPLLTPVQTIRIATIEGAKDPDDLIKQSGKSAMDTVLKQAKPMIDVIWEMTLAGRQLRTPEERGSFIAAIKQRVARISNENLRQLYQDEISKRLASTFNWRNNKPTSETPRRNDGKKAPWQNAQTQIPFINRKQPMNAQRLRERAFLALIINHPDLFTDFGEDLAHIDFISPENEALRQRVIEILSLDTGEPLSAAELQRQLMETASINWERTPIPDSLSQVLSESTYMHVAFARPDRPLEQAREGWKSIWKKHLQEQLQTELQVASRRYAEEATDENLMRLVALREQVESLAGTNDTETSEAV